MSRLVSGLKKAAKALAYAVFLLVTTLVLLEVSMIVLEPYLFKGFYQYDEDMGFRVRPHANGTNRFGFNDRDYPLQKDDGTFRILVVGDSFSWVGGRQQNYAAKLERKFEAHFGKHKVDVINSGYSMTHTAEQLPMLKKFGLQYEPDMVFLGFFIGNDFVEADPMRKRIVVNDVHFDIDRRDELTFLGYPLVDQSRFLHFVEQKYKAFTELRRGQQELQKQAGEQEPQENVATLPEDLFLRFEKGRLGFFNKERHAEGFYKPQIDYIFSALAEMRDLLEGRNIRFIVGIYPDEFQVSRALLEQVYQRFDLNPQTYDLDLGQNLLKDYLDAQGIEYLDMTGPFRRQGETERLYLLQDTHWNDAGRALAADIMFDALIDEVEQAVGADATR